MTLNGHGYAHRCGECDAEPMWSLVRKGDVVCNWACSEHFNEVALFLQRDHEITELVVVHSPKAVEWAEINRTLESVINEGKSRHFCGTHNEPGAQWCSYCHGDLNP